jgi:multidrug efflux system membrane fusion protein
MFSTPFAERFFWPKSEERRKSSAFHRYKSSFSIAVAALAALSLSACQEEKVADEQPVRPVKAIVVYQQSGQVARTFSGDIRARTESSLGFRVSGKIVERLVDTGDTISEGQTIARLDDTDLLLSENSARAAVQSATTRLAVAQDALKRAKTLQPKGYTPASVVDQRLLEVDAAKAALESAEALFRQASNAKGYALLKADQAGIVTAVQAEAGQVVQTGTPVVLLAADGDKEVALNVPEQDVIRLTIGQEAELTLWADKSMKAKGRISEIAGQADPASRTYAVRIAIDNPPATMRLGMTASATLWLGSDMSYTPLPLAALTLIEGRKAVFVVDRATSRVSPRFIETDGVMQDAVKVKTGLAVGEIVVTGGVQFLTDGMQVRLPDDVIQTASIPFSETQR